MFDSLSKIEDPYEGQKFASFEVLKKYLEEYGKRNFVKFWIRSSHTINSLKSKVPKKLNPELKYICMKFACIFGGEKIRCRGSGIRKSTTYRNLGCPCMINAVIGEDGNHVKLDTVILEHNHALCKSLYDSLKKAKKKSEQVENQDHKIKEEPDIKKLTESPTAKNLPSDNNEVTLCLPEASNIFVKTEVDIKNDNDEQSKEFTNPQDYLKNIQEMYGGNVKIIVVDPENSDMNIQPDETPRSECDTGEPPQLTENSGDNKVLMSEPESDICRLCLSSSNNLSPIFKSGLPLASTILAFKIMGCASIEVTSGDGLPASICSSCETTLDIAYNFRITCEKSDSILRKLYSIDKPYIEKFTNVKDFETPVEAVNENTSCQVLEIETETDNSSQLNTEVLFITDEGESFTHQNIIVSNENNMEKEVSLPYLNFSCPVCYQSFNSYLLMWKHLKDHSQDESLLLSCNICNAVCERVPSLSKHMLGHIAAAGEDWVSQLFHCPLCDMTYLSQEEFLEHKETHKIVKTDAQPPYAVENSFQVETKNTPSSNNYLCNVCGKILKTKERFQSHKNTHEGLKPYVCIKCGKGFADRKNMHQHFDVVHLRKAKHECPICQKKFYTRTKMKSHQTVHYGLKPFTCDICNKTFRLKMNMIKHKKTHSNVRPHQCDKCNAAFIDKNMLKRHSYIHGGIRPYPCPICGHRFSVRFHLKKHLEKNKCHGNTHLSTDEWIGISQTDFNLVGSECVVVYENSNEDNVLQETENGPMTMDILQQYDDSKTVVVQGHSEV